MKRIIEAGAFRVPELQIIRDKEKLKAEHRDTLGQLYLGRRSEVVVESDDELRALFNYMLRLGLGLDTEAGQAFDQVTEAVEDKNVELLCDAADQAGTHTNKHLDMRIPHRQILAWPQAQKGAISSADTERSRPVYGCGQSAQSLARLFWTRDFTDARNGGQSRSCFLFLLADPAIQDCTAALSNGQKQMLAQASGSRAGERTPAHPGPKQVYLPLMGDDGDINDYLLVSPVLSLAMIEELSHGVHTFHQRHFTEAEGNRFHPRTPRSFVHVGGSKPQNIGDIFSSLGGRIRGLESNIPRGRRTASLAERVRDGFDLICLSPGVNAEAQWISRPLQHKNQNESYTKAFKSYMFEALRLIRVYRKQRNDSLAAQSTEEAWPLPAPGKGLSDLSIALLSKSTLSADEVDRFTEALISKIQKQAMPDVPVTDGHLKIMRPVIQTTLRRWTNGRAAGAAA